MYTQTISECLLTPLVFSGITSGKINDRMQLVLIELIANIAKRCLDALSSGEVFKLDPNPGDQGCQIRAIVLFNTMQDQEFLAEAKALLPVAQRLGEIVIGLRRAEYKKLQPAMREEANQLLFMNQKGSILCSKTMQFVLLSGFLNALRDPYRTLPNGIVMSQTEPSKLYQYSKNINKDLLKVYRDDIVNQAQGKLTFLSMESIRDVASRITLMDSENKGIMERMLSAENTVITAPKAPYPAKAIGCQFFLTEATVQTLREKQGLVAIKSIVPAGQENFIRFFRSSTAGADLEPVLLEDVRGFNSDTPLVVFQGVVGVSSEELIERIRLVGLTRMFLIDGSIQKQYGSEIKAEQLQQSEARERILSFKKDAEDILGKGVLQLLECNETPTLMLYHLFANTLGSELSRMNITLKDNVK